METTRVAGLDALRIGYNEFVIDWDFISLLLRSKSLTTGSIPLKIEGCLAFSIASIRFWGRIS